MTQDQTTYDDFEDAVQAVEQGEDVPHEVMDEIIVEAIGELQDDPDTDLDARTRQDAGWFKVYVECPDCSTPLVRAQTEAKSDSVETQAGSTLDRSRSHTVGVCPQCREFKTAIQLVRLSGPVGDVPDPDESAWTWWFEGRDDDQ